jgi:hypothetical protein
MDFEDKPYWNLKVFRSEDPKEKKIYFRKLLLDFIYDLEHTHVFENSPYYEEAEVRLRENFMFNAIAAKAAYYWNRHNWIKKLYEEQREKDTSGEHTGNDEKGGKAIYAENLAATEKQWLDILRSEQSCEYCSYSSGWFQSVEKEYEDVILPESKNKHAEEVFDRYEWRQTLKQGSNSRDQNHTTYEKDNLNITRESVRWFLRRYNFISAARLLWNFCKLRHREFILAAILGLVIVAYIGCANDTNYLFVKICIYYLLWSICLLIVFLLLFIIRSAFSALRKRIPCFMKKDQSFHKDSSGLALPVLGMLMPRLIMAISSAWIFITTTEEIYKSSFDVTFSTGWWVALLIIPIMLFMMLEVRNIAPDVKSSSIFYRCIVVLGIGFIYSLIIGMFFINFTAKRILPRSDYLPTFYHELDNTKWENPYKGKELEKIKKSNSSNLYDDLGKVHLKSNEIYRVLPEWPVLLKIKIVCFDLDVLPVMLLFRTFFALFIGIFIQLIFEDKPITEPL